MQKRGQILTELEAIGRAVATARGLKFFRNHRAALDANEDLPALCLRDGSASTEHRENTRYPKSFVHWRMEPEFVLKVDYRADEAEARALMDTAAQDLLDGVLASETIHILTGNNIPVGAQISSDDDETAPFGNTGIILDIPFTA